MAETASIIPLRTPSSSAASSAALVDLDGAAHDVERELGSGDGGDLEDLRWSPGPAVTVDRSRRLGRSPGFASSAKGRTSLPVPFSISSAPVSVSVRHSSVMRNALPSVSSLITARELPQRRVELASGAPAHELGDLVARSGREAPGAPRPPRAAGRRAPPTARWACRPACPGRWREGACARPPPSARDDAAGAASARRPSARPRRRAASAGGELTLASRSDTAVCRRWRSLSGSPGPGSGSSPTRCGRSGSSRVSSPPPVPRSERSTSGSVDALELLERGDERPVRGADECVAGAVEDENAVSRRLLGQLPDEPALPRAGLAGEQDDPPAFARGARQERPQRGELPRAPDERERRRQAEWTGKSQHVQPRS